MVLLICIAGMGAAHACSSKSADPKAASSLGLDVRAGDNSPVTLDVVSDLHTRNEAHLTDIKLGICSILLVLFVCLFVFLGWFLWTRCKTWDQARILRRAESVAKRYKRPPNLVTETKA